MEKFTCSRTTSPPNTKFFAFYNIEGIFCLVLAIFLRLPHTKERSHWNLTSCISSWENSIEHKSNSLSDECSLITVSFWSLVRAVGRPVVFSTENQSTWRLGVFQQSAPSRLSVDALLYTGWNIIINGPACKDCKCLVAMLQFQKFCFKNPFVYLMG